MNSTAVTTSSFFTYDSLFLSFTQNPSTSFLLDHDILSALLFFQLVPTTCKAIDASYTHPTPIQLHHPIVVLNFFNLQPLSSYPSILGYIHLILPQLTFLTSPFYFSILVVPYSNPRFHVQLTKVIMIHDQPLLDNHNLFISPHVDTTTYSLDLLFGECYTPHDFIQVLCNPPIFFPGTM